MSTERLPTALKLNIEQSACPQIGRWVVSAAVVVPSGETHLAKLSSGALVNLVKLGVLFPCNAYTSY